MKACFHVFKIINNSLYDVVFKLHQQVGNGCLRLVREMANMQVGLKNIYVRRLILTKIK